MVTGRSLVIAAWLGCEPGCRGVRGKQVLRKRGARADSPLELGNEGTRVQSFKGEEGRRDTSVFVGPSRSGQMKECGWGGMNISWSHWNPSGECDVFFLLAEGGLQVKWQQWWRQKIL